MLASHSFLLVSIRTLAYIVYTKRSTRATRRYSKAWNASQFYGGCKRDTLLAFAADRRATELRAAAAPLLLGARRLLQAHRAAIDRYRLSARLSAANPPVPDLMGLLQLRFEHDSSTIRLRDAYDSSAIRARYNILRGVMCFRAIMNMSILLRCCRML